MGLETLSEHRCFGGVQGFYRHASAEIGLPMKFGVFVPPQASHGPVPVLFYLAGLTCTEETFAIKAGAQRVAAELGLMLVSPDTSPRDTGIEGASAAWDFGHGAGFYLDATQAPWAKHFRMESWVTKELRELVLCGFPRRPTAWGSLGTPWVDTVPSRWLCATRVTIRASRPLPRSPRRCSVRGARKLSVATWAMTVRRGQRMTRPNS